MLKTEQEKRIEKLELQVDGLFKINYDLKEQLAKEVKRREELVLENSNLRKELQKANTTIENLTARIKKNSKNSSKPSSTDSIYTKTIHNFREKTDRKLGGQAGHIGHTIKKFQNPTQIIDKKITQCDCGGVIENEEKYSSKQVVDIRIAVDVIEERVHEGVCKKCGKLHIGKFSEEFKNPVQYGNNLKALTTLLLDEGYISLNRCVKLLKDITNGKITVTEGSIINFKKEIENKSGTILETIRQALISSEILHVDETGARIMGGLGWMHTTTTGKHTMYQMKDCRNPDKEDELKILPFFIGTLIHDHFKSYYQYKLMKHGECNAHILRYLEAVIDSLKRKGAQALLDFLVRINNEKKESLKAGISSFTEQKLEKIESEYLKILAGWSKEHTRSIKNGKFSKPLQEEQLLIQRLTDYKDEHLLFVYDFKVPFDNNMAERALRMIKTKLKVSGCFRGKDRGRNFAVIRSVLETAKKHEMNLCDTIGKILRGEEVQFATA